MKKLFYSSFVLFALLVVVKTSDAQCPIPSNNFENFGKFELTPTGIGDTVRNVGGTWGGDYHHVKVTTGKKYVISLCNTHYAHGSNALNTSGWNPHPDTVGFDPILTLYHDTQTVAGTFNGLSGPIVGFDDNGCGTGSLMPMITYTATFTGNLAVAIDSVGACDKFIVDSTRIFVTEISPGPPALSISLSTSYITTNGANNGAIKVTASGGTTPYTYLWSTGATTDSIGGLSPGTYIVTVTDSSSTTKIDSVTLIEPPLTDDYPDSFINIMATHPAGLDSATLPTNPTRFGSVELADIDNDGDLDLISGSNKGKLFLFRNKGSATSPNWKLDTGTIFTLDSIHITPNQPTNEVRPTLVDIDGDGDLDLFVGSRWAPNGTHKLDDIHFYRNIGTKYNAVFTLDTIQGLQFQQVSEFVHISPVDIDGDGDLDIVCAGSDSISYFLNIGTIYAPHYVRVYGKATNGPGKPHNPFPVPWIETSFLTATPRFIDFDEDGDLDMFFMNEAGFIRYIPNLGSVVLANFSPGTSYPVPSLDTTDFGAFGTIDMKDVDGDGVIDLVCNHWNPTTFYWYKGASSGLKTSISTDSVISCNGSSNGALSVSVTGGKSPYSYSWSNGDTTVSISGLDTGTYKVVVTDSLGIKDSATIVITQPNVLVASATIVTNVSCYGLSNGKVTASATGGTATYTYAWSNSATTASITGLATGSYVVTITDSKGCSDIDTATVTEPTVLMTSTSATMATTITSADASATTSTSGGTSPYNYVWINGAIGATASNLMVGKYRVSVTDKNGCTVVDSVEVTSGPSVTLAVDSNVSCNGLSDGAATASVTGGTTPYSYAWSNSDTTASIFGLAAGSYTVTVTDSVGDTNSTSITITQPDSLSVTATISSNVSCFGESDGTAVATINGGTPAYDLLWSNGQTTNATIGGSVSGSSSTVVYEQSFEALASDNLSYSHFPVSYNTDGDSTFGTGNLWGVVQEITGKTTAASGLYFWGGADLTNSNGGGSFAHYLTTDAADVSNYSNVNLSFHYYAQNYSLGQYVKYEVLFDSSSNFTTGGTFLNKNTSGWDSVSIAVPDTAKYVRVRISSQQDGAYFGLDNIKIEGEFISTAFGSQLSGFAAGSQNVIVTDTNGCKDTATFSITEPTQVLASINQGDTACYALGDSVQLTVTPQTGVTYEWNKPGELDSFITVGSAGFSAGPTGNTTLVTDGNNVPYLAYSDGVNSHKATVQKFNGTTWITVGTGGLSAGNADHLSLAINGNNVPYIAYQDNANSGKATVQKFNGTSWVTVGTVGFSAAYADNLSLAFDGNNIPYLAYLDGANSNKSTVQKYNGTSWVTVGSAGFSAGTVSYTSLAIDGNDVPYVGYRDVANSNKATVMKFDGTSWVAVGSAGFSAGNTFFNSLAIDGNNMPYVGYRDAANSNKATVMKFNGTTWVVLGSAGFSAGLADFASLAIDGNNVPYIGYQDGANSKNATVMKFNGTSWVTVGSTGFSAGRVNEPSLAIDGNNVPYIAYGDGTSSNKASVMKATGGLQLISNASSAFGSDSSLVILIATDTATGCTNTDTIYVEVCKTPRVSITLDSNVSCYGLSDAGLTASVKAGIPPYSYAWSNSDTGTVLTGLPIGTYFVTVTDSLGDTNSTSITITQPDSLVITASVDSNLSCYGANDGGATATITGGTKNFSLLWGNGNMSSVTDTNAMGIYTANADSLLPGNQQVLITDANGCTDSAIFTITQPDSISVNFVIDSNETCTNEQDGGFTAVVTGGTRNYTFLWFGAPAPVTDTSYTGAGTGTYNVKVEDAKGCFLITSVFVPLIDDIAPQAVVKNITAYLNASGSAIIQASDIDSMSADNCLIDSLAIDKTTFDCADTGANTVRFIVVDWKGNSDTATATVTVLDTIKPIVVAQNLTAYLSASGTVNITAADINNGSYDSCGVSLALSNTMFTCSDTGSNTIYLIGTDVNGNVDSAVATVTVLDTIKPTVLVQNKTVYLNASGAGSIAVGDINNGSYDSCGIATLSLSNMNYTCTDTGSNTVYLTAVDVNGNIDSAMATVTIIDTIKPVVATQNLALYLNASGAASITTSDVDNGTYDSCGVSLSLSKSSFSCADTGSNTVYLIATDVNGNVDSASATITVSDTIKPTINTNNVTVYLDASGMSSVAVSDVNNSSSDNCTIASLVLSDTNFDCSNTGANTVYLIGVDVNGNVDSSLATITVLDTISPVLTVNSKIQVCAITAAGTEVTYSNSATDNCAPKAIVQTAGLVSGSVFPQGTTWNVFSVEDSSGNTVVDSFSVEIYAFQALTIDSIGERCENDSLVTLVGTPTGGTFSGTGVTAGKLDPAVVSNGAVAITYTFTTPQSCTYSDSIFALVRPLPLVQLGSFSDTVCLEDEQVACPVATPSGGIYSGAGVNGILFETGAPGVGVGEHLVRYTYQDIYGCVNTDSTVANVLNCFDPAGVRLNAVANVVRIFPNPNKGNFTIEHNLEQAVSAELISPLGQVVRVIELNNSSNEVVLDNPAPGMYLVRISGEGVNQLHRIVIQ